MHLRAAMFALSTILMPNLARADAGEVSAGGLASWRIADGGRLGGAAEVGINDVLAARLEMQAGYAAKDHWEALGALGVTAMLDVFSWVPAITLGVGASGVAHPWGVYGLARVEVRRWVTPALWLGVGAGLERDARGWLGTVTLSVFGKS